MLAKTRGLSVTAFRLGLENGRDVAERVEAGARDRRLAADRVGVLHAVAMEVRGSDLAVPHQLAQRGGDVGLTGMAAELLDSSIERAVAALDRVGGHGPGHQGCGQDVLGAEDRSEGQRRGHLGPIEQRKALLRR